MDEILKVYKSSNFAIIATTIIVLFFIIIVGIKLKKHDPDKPPKGILLLAEMLVSWTNGMCQEGQGGKNLLLMFYVKECFYLLLT